ncbi:MAG: aminotransferase class I/II-fold pyridoxal phosphate-dependent enzyme [FCB group bacterium]|nr:aminotransferase class I/II-fold pyridoxal phosphate-dependent enzyme [FCB group bacterium]
MTKPYISNLFRNRKPSVLRQAKQVYDRRPDRDEVDVINLAIGNVNLPIHPAMQERMRSLCDPGSPFAEGVVQYSRTIGSEETRQAFLNVIAASGFDTSNLVCQITDGASQAMELIIAGVCGDAGTDDKPLLLIEAAYTNYMAFATRLGRKTICITRTLDENGKFAIPDLEKIEAIIKQEKPSGILIIPSDNPTGQHMKYDTLTTLAKLCVEDNLWLISDETYRELHFLTDETTSIWGLTEEDVPGITGRRIGIESASKVWNGCGLRIGALVTDNPEFLEKSVIEYMSNLCANVIGQYIFGAIAHEDHAELKTWFDRQRQYYREIIRTCVTGLRREIPGIIVSSPEAAIYTVLDVRKIVKPGFTANDFVNYCAGQGRVHLEDGDFTLLVAPMTGFYNNHNIQDNPGRTQMRLAYVARPETMQKVPYLFKKLLEDYEAQRHS